MHCFTSQKNLPFFPCFYFEFIEEGLHLQNSKCAQKERVFRPPEKVVKMKYLRIGHPQSSCSEIIFLMNFGLIYKIYKKLLFKKQPMLVRGVRVTRFLSIRPRLLIFFNYIL